MQSKPCPERRLTGESNTLTSPSRIPLPSSQPNISYELTLSRLPAQSLWPDLRVQMVAKPCRVPARRDQGSARGTPTRRSCSAGRSCWESLWHLSPPYHHQTQGGSAIAPAMKAERSLQNPGSSWSPHEEGPQLLGLGALSARLLQRTGRKEK